MYSLLVPPKTWIYFCCHSKEVWISGAWVNLRYGASFFVSIFDLRANRKIFDESFLMLPEIQLKVASTQFSQGRHWEAQGGARNVRTRLAMREQAGSIEINLPKAGIHVALELEFPNASLQVHSSFESRAPGFTEKTWGQVRSGTISLPPTQKASKSLAGDAQLKIDMAGAPIAVDFTKSYLPRQTQWHWALLLDPKLNLAAGNHLGSAIENAVSLPTGIEALPEVTFDIPPATPSSAKPLPWKIEGRGLTLLFEPRFCHRENRNWGILKTHFEQWVGVFDGEVNTMGTSHPISKVWGVAEKQDCKW